MGLAALRGCFGPAGVPRVLWVLLVALRGCHSPCRGAAGCVACCSKHCYAASGNPQTCSLRNDSSQNLFRRSRLLLDIWFLDLCSLLVKVAVVGVPIQFRSSIQSYRYMGVIICSLPPRTLHTMATQRNGHQWSHWGNGCC